MQLGIHRKHYRIHEITPYINWAYFYFAWGFSPKFAAPETFGHCPACLQSWIQSFPAEEREKAREAVSLWKEAQHLLFLFDAEFETRGNVRLAECNSRENDLLLNIDGKQQVLPLLRQQSGQPPYLCLNDFIRPVTQEKADVIGIFCTTVNARMEQSYPDDSYRHLLAQTLADRLAEATAEKLHEEVRKEIWGYAAEEDLTPAQMNAEEFQGIRPAVGYPSLPDISINRIILPWVDASEMGVQLTDHAMMQPHASVSGLMLAHPQSHYFSVGKIGQDQLDSYASRRNMPVSVLRPFLRANL